ncbi:hypothetical protein MASR1M45_18290 [Candidatus Kapaibacterium sp.]
MKQKMFTLFAVVILFAATTADSFAQLTKIWDRSNENFALERLCRPGKLAVVSRNGQFLIDLTNGETIHSTQYPEAIYFNYWGDRYYVHHITENITHEYDVKTRQFIKEVKGIPRHSDSSSIGFNYTYHSIIIKNANSGILLDSFKIPNTPDEPAYSTYHSGFTTSNDARFVAFYLQKNFQPTAMYFLLYDRVAREIIMQKDLPVNGTFNFRFFNTKNHMAYVENIKLPGDGKPYSYIRIYDPEKREVVKNIKIGDDIDFIRTFILRDDDRFILYRTKGTNYTRFYNLENEIFLDFTILVSSPIFADDSIIVNLNIEGFKFDWNAVGVEEEPNPDIPVIYPNPTTNSINLNIDEKFYNGQWQLTDLSGRDILNGIILSNPQLQIDISNLPSATYYLRLTNGKEIKVEKVVKW